MALSRIHLPSISSVLTSNRVFHPGHSAATKLDMGSTLPSVPDHLMKTIRPNESASCGNQDSSTEIGPQLDTVIEEEESVATTGESLSTLRRTASKSSTSHKNRKHDRRSLLSSLRILYPSKLVRSFSRRSGLRGRACS